MADVLITEDYEDGAEDSTESCLTISASQIRVVIEGTVESLKLLSDEDEDDINDPLDDDLRQRPSESETDHYGADDLVSPDELLPPVPKLEKYANSEIVFNRQVVARNILDTLRVVLGNQDDVDRVLAVLCSLSEDYEPSVRSQLMEQIPHLAAYCREHPSILVNTIQKYIVPMIINYIDDGNNQVRKTCHTALITLIEQRLLDSHSVNERICPVIIEQTEGNHPDEQRAEGVTLMMKVATLIGKESSEKLFLEKFCILCMDESHHVRKVCACSFGDFSGILGREITEEKLLSKFFCLCEDPMWGVRKSCADVFMPVSCICSMETRHRDLTNVFMTFLIDQSRWVRLASFQALGPFISTFAEPDKTGLYYTKDGVLTVVDVPYTPLEQSVASSQRSECAESDVSSGSSSESGSFYSCLDRTNSPSNSCDNVVPLCSTENTFSTSEVPSISCHSGNYCTVIEVSSPATLPIEDENPTTPVNPIGTTHLPVKNGIDYEPDNMPGAISNNTVNLNHSFREFDLKYISSSSDSSEDEDIDDSNEAFNKLWYEALYGLPEEGVPLLNGDLSSEINEDDSDRLVENHVDSDSPDSTYNSREFESALLSTVTVNGINISSSVALSGPLNCEVLPVVNYNAIVNENNGNTERNSNSSFETNNIDHLESGDQSNDVLHSTESTCTEKQSNLLVADMCHDVNSHTSAIQQDSGNESTPKTVIEVTSGKLKVEKPVDNESAFNHFQYWRTPLPEIDTSIVGKYLAFEANSAISDHENVSANCSSQECRQNLFGDVRSSTCLKDFMHTTNIGSSCCRRDRLDNMLNSGSVTVSFGGTEHTLSEVDDETIKSAKDTCLSGQDKEAEPPPTTSRRFYSVHDQDIIPPELLLRYLSMTDVTRAQTVDSEIARHCAYSLPAVALTLGRRFWPCLRETYNTLASDMQGFIMQWKVRRTLASSMHQIAVILGPDITAKDLVPIFSGFIRDLDEVRIGILQHVSEFLKVLRIEERRLFLTQLSEFLSPDNDRNWRFRLILAEQLIPIADLYHPEDVRDYLVPLCLALVWDKICEVRLAAVRVMAAMMRRMSQSPTPALTKGVLTELADKFIHAPKWLHRQIYVYLCQEFITENSLPPDQFAEDAMPHLLYLCWDRVPNVRVAIARCLAAVIWPLETFSNPDSPHRELLLQTIHTLQSDVDADVRYYANMVSTHECSCLQHSDLNDLASESFI